MFYTRKPVVFELEGEYIFIFVSHGIRSSFGTNQKHFLPRYAPWFFSSSGNSFMYEDLGGMTLPWRVSFRTAPFQSYAPTAPTRIPSFKRRVCICLHWLHHKPLHFYERDMHIQSLVEENKLRDLGSCTCSESSASVMGWWLTAWQWLQRYRECKQRVLPNRSWTDPRAPSKTLHCINIWAFSIQTHPNQCHQYTLGHIVLLQFWCTVRLTVQY